MSTSTNVSLQTIRNKIDRLDEQVVALLNERMRLVAEIGKLKKERGQSVFAPEREDLLLKALENLNSGPLGQVGLRAIYREILSASRANQSKLRVVYLGEQQSQNFLAARMRFGSSDCYRGEREWRALVQSMEKNEADVAVVPRDDLIQALGLKASEKPFTRSLRVCGEINLVREIQADAEMPEPIKSWRGVEQFYILANGADKQTLDGKSLFFLAVSDLGKVEVLSEMIAQHGAALQSAVALLPKGERFLCEVYGEIRWDNLVEQITSHWGRSAITVLLGTYPTPHIYG